MALPFIEPPFTHTQNLLSMIDPALNTYLKELIIPAFRLVCKLLTSVRDRLTCDSPKAVLLKLEVLRGTKSKSLAEELMPYELEGYNLCGLTR